MQTLESCITPVFAVFPHLTAYFGETCYSIGSSVCGDDVAISPALKYPDRNTDTPTSLTFPGTVGDGLTDNEQFGHARLGAPRRTRRLVSLTSSLAQHAGLSTFSGHVLAGLHRHQSAAHPL
ncbi:hypothetical protein C3984_03136 [Escherichia coli]|nr:hypothetical protein C3984_03136 [Escherichia coli]